MAGANTFEWEDGFAGSRIELTVTTATALSVESSHSCHCWKALILFSCSAGWNEHAAMLCWME